MHANALDALIMRGFDGFCAINESQFRHRAVISETSVIISTCQSSVSARFMANFIIDPDYRG